MPIPLVADAQSSLRLAVLGTTRGTVAYAMAESVPRLMPRVARNDFPRATRHLPKVSSPLGSAARALRAVAPNAAFCGASHHLHDSTGEIP